MASAPAPGVLHVITFVTATGRRCYFAVETTAEADGSAARVRLPPQVTAQLEAMGARTAWWWVGPPRSLKVPGEASALSGPVTADAATERGRLVFL